MLLANDSFAASPWEGIWEYGRYAPAYGGSLEIKNCRDNKCDFRIITAHGAHLCNNDGVMEVDGNKAKYVLKLDCGPEKKPEVTSFKLDPQKKTIEVDGYSSYFCGMRGYYGGVYEHESNPLRYPTSFNCWNDNLNTAEKEICADFNLSLADMELEKVYPQTKTPQWYNKRNNCLADKKCIWSLYVNTIKNEYQKETKSEFNLFAYVKNKNLNNYFLNNIAVVNDYFLTHMEKDDYEAWQVTLNDDGYDDGSADYHMQSFGVAGLYTMYESAIYIDENDVWLTFVSANLKEPLNDNVIVYRPKGKTIENMPLIMREYTENLSKRSAKKIVEKDFRESWKESFIRIIKQITDWLKNTTKL